MPLYKRLELVNSFDKAQLFVKRSWRLRPDDRGDLAQVGSTSQLAGEHVEDGVVDAQVHPTRPDVDHHAVHPGPPIPEIGVHRTAVARHHVGLSDQHRAPSFATAQHHQRDDRGEEEQVPDDCEHDERVTVELICDLVHLHPTAVRLAARHAGLKRTVLITDAIAAAGVGDGVYDVGGLEVRVVDGMVVVGARRETISSCEP